MHRGTRLLAAAFCCAIAAPDLVAQNASQAVDRAQLLRPQIPALGQNISPEGEDQGYAAVSPNDPDLGEQQILKRAERYKAFRFILAAPLYYTSNVALTRRGERSDVVLAPEVSLTWLPRINKTLFAEATVRQQFFYYNRFGALDFGSFDAGGGIVYQMPKAHNLTLRARYNYNRLTNSGHDEIFANHSLFFGAEVPFAIGRAQQFVLGASANISIAAEPEGPRRHDFEVHAGYAANVTRAFSVGASAQLALREYQATSRRDVSEIFALTANYQINDWLSVGAITTFAFNQSNRSVFDYTVINVGGAVALSIAF